MTMTMVNIIGHGRTYPKFFLPLWSHEPLFGFFPRGLSFESCSNLGLLSVDVRHLAAKTDFWCKLLFLRIIFRKVWKQFFINLLVLSHTGGKTWTKGAFSGDSSQAPAGCSLLAVPSASKVAQQLGLPLKNSPSSAKKPRRAPRPPRPKTVHGL